MHKQTVYVTYDLPQDAGDPGGVPQARSMTLQGHLVRYEIGEFKSQSGKMVTGVHVTVILEDEEDVEKELIEIPANARNVQVHVDRLPERYREHLKQAA
jgi:hypothetical protein